MVQRMCGECGGKAVYIVEPVGRYDSMGWAEQPTCEEHLGLTAAEYIGDDIPRVQVRFIDTEQYRNLEECCNEGCDVLVGDGGGWCHNCEQAFIKAMASPVGVEWDG